jgi:hypothetical protein
MADTERVKIPAGRYNVSGTMKVYTHLLVREDETFSVEKDVMPIETHQLDAPADVWDEDENKVSKELAEAIVERLNDEPSAWDSSDGMRWD